MPTEWTVEQRAKAKESRAATIEGRKPVNRDDCSELLRVLNAEVPAKYRGHLQKMMDGSLRAAVTLHCLQCVAYERAEVTECVARHCPLLPFRPYQREAE